MADGNVDVWCLVIDDQQKPLRNMNRIKCRLSRRADVTELREAVKLKCAHSLAAVDAGTLKVWQCVGDPGFDFRATKTLGETINKIFTAGEVKELDDDSAMEELVFSSRVPLLVQLPGMSCSFV